MKSHNFRFLLPIWGNDHISFFMCFVAPTLIAEGNFPAMADHNVKLNILTRKCDQKAIQSWPIFNILKQHCEIEFNWIDDILKQELPKHVLHRCYQLGYVLEKRSHNQVFFVHLNSDVIFANENCKYLINAANNGVVCLMEAVFRADYKTLFDDLMPYQETSNQLSITTDELVKIGLENIHPATEHSIINETKEINLLANRLYWRVGKEGLLAHNFLMHPLMLRPKERIGYYEGFLDYALVPLTYPNKKDWTIIQDSSDFFRLEFAHPDYETNEMSNGKTFIKALETPLNNWTTKEHRYFASIKTMYHCGKQSSIWSNIEFDAKTYIDELISTLSPEPQKGVNAPFWTGNSGKKDEGKSNGLMFQKRFPETYQKIKQFYLKLKNSHEKMEHGYSSKTFFEEEVNGHVLIATSLTSPTSIDYSSLLSNVTSVCCKYYTNSIFTKDEWINNIHGESINTFDFIIVETELLCPMHFNYLISDIKKISTENTSIVFMNPVPTSTEGQMYIPDLRWIKYNLSRDIVDYAYIDTGSAMLFNQLRKCKESLAKLKLERSLYKTILPNFFKLLLNEALLRFYGKFWLKPDNKFGLLIVRLSK